jgi:flagellar hook-associated protein 2
MGSIVSSGVGSGLDIAGLVQQLVQAEGGPKTLRLDAEEAKVQGKLSALGTLRSALATFRGTVATLKDIAKFQGRSVALSTPDFLSATAGATAVPGTYSIEVEQLAAAHKLQSTNFASAATVVGTGTLRITTGGQIFDVEIGSLSNTLSGIAAAINSSAAGSRVVATVINGAGESRLTISSRESGAANAMTITQSGGDGGLVALTYPPSGSGMTQLQQALNAQARIDGILVTGTSNTIGGAIAGVDVTLLEQNEDDETTTLTVGFNRTAARKTIDDFAKAYNAVVDAINSVSSYDAETRQGGPLFGDAGVRNIVHQLRRELTSNATGLTGPFDMLAEIGITADLTGKLSVDAADLDAAFTADFDSIGELFATSEVGVAVKLDRLLAPYLDSGGIFDTRTAGLKTTIDDINERRVALGTRLEALQARYTKQFNALDSLLAQLQSTSGFLTQQLSRLPGATPISNNG